MIHITYVEHPTPLIAPLVWKDRNINLEVDQSADIIFTERRIFIIEDSSVLQTKKELVGKFEAWVE